MPKGLVWFCVIFLLLLATLGLVSCASSTSAVVTEAWRQPLDSPTTYTVKKSDTLYSIAWSYGLDYRQIAILNKIKPPYHILVNQKLRLENVALPHSTLQVKKTSSSAINTQSPSRKLSSSTSTVSNTTPQQIVQEEISSADTPQEELTLPISQIKVKTEKKSGIIWAWPTHKGRLLQGFSCTNLNKGIDIVGNAGTPILAAAAGKIVYAGNGLRGYGEMLIIKHSDEFLSAYAHNKKLLVREGQSVKVRQIIALMGNTEARRVLLHFEIRQTGKPVDPLKYLPKR